MPRSAPFPLEMDCIYFKPICFVWFFFQGTQWLCSIISTMLTPGKTHPSFCAVGSEGKSSKPAGSRFFHLASSPSTLQQVCPLPNFKIFTSLTVGSNSEARPLELIFNHAQGHCADGISVGTGCCRLVVICVISGGAFRLERAKKPQRNNKQTIPVGRGGR